MKNCYDLFGLLRRFTPSNDSTSIFGFLNAVIQLYQYFIEISEEPLIILNFNPDKLRSYNIIYFLLNL
jgi:hypothetical protein